MTIRNERFEKILKTAFSDLDISDNELKDKYKDYPICLMMKICVNMLSSTLIIVRI